MEIILQDFKDLFKILMYAFGPFFSMRMLMLFLPMFLISVSLALLWHLKARNKPFLGMLLIIMSTTFVNYFYWVFLLNMGRVECREVVGAGLCFFLFIGYLFFSLFICGIVLSVFPAIKWNKSVRNAEKHFHSIWLLISLVFFISVSLPQKSYGWGFLTHVILNKKAYEQATFIEAELDKILFQNAGMYPDMISSWVVNPFNIDPNKHRYDYGHLLIDKDSLKPLDVDLDYQSSGIPLFGIKMIKAYILKGYDNPYGLPKRFLLDTNTGLNPNKNMAFGWVAHQIGDKHAHGPDGFSNSVNVYPSLPSFLKKYLSHGVNEAAVDAIMLLDYASELQNIKLKINPALMHEASILYYNQIGKIGLDPMNKKDHIFKCNFVRDDLHLAFVIGYIVDMSIAAIYQLIPGLRSYYETAPNDYRTTWFNPAVTEVKSLLADPGSFLNQDIDFSTDGLNIPPDPPLMAKQFASNPQQQAPSFDVYRAFIASVGEEAEKLGAFTIDVRVISEDPNVAGSKTYEISGEVTNQEAFNTALNNVIQEWLSYPSDVEDPIKLSQKIFAKFTYAALTKQGFTFQQILRYSEDVFPPTVKILSPEDKDIVNGILKITGTAADDQYVHNFKSYKVEVGQGETPTTWTQIGSGTQEVTENGLATWDTRSLSGLYTIKLTADDTMENSSETKILLYIGDPIFISSFGKKGEKQGEFKEPKGIFVDAQENIYVADTENNRVQKFDKNFNVLLKIGGEEKKEKHFLKEPEGVYGDTQGSIYVADTHNHQIKKFDPQGNLILSIGTKSKGEHEEQEEGKNTGEFNQPVGVAVSQDGKIYVTDSHNDRVQVFDASGNFLFAFGSHGKKEGEFNKPHGISLDSDLNIYVADTENNRIQGFSKEGHFLFSYGGEKEENGKDENEEKNKEKEILNKPDGVFVDGSKNILIADTKNDRVVKLNKYKNVVFRFSNNFKEPSAVFVFGGKLYVCDTKNNIIKIYAIKYNSTLTETLTPQKPDDKKNMSNPDEPLASKILSYPSPVRGDTIHFAYPLTNKGKQRAKDGGLLITIEVFSLSGKKISEFSCDAADESCNWQQNLANGVYIYRITLNDVTGEKESKVGKIVVVK